jgi:hypothetical protein
MIGIDAPPWDTVGAIRLSGAYGGWAVHRIVNTSGGVTDLSGGHGPARGVAEFLSGMIAALRIVKDQTNV